MPSGPGDLSDSSIRNLFNTSLSSNKLLPNGLAENMEEGKNLSESLGQNSASDVKKSVQMTYRAIPQPHNH